jgi:hypothetical protein
MSCIRRPVEVLFLVLASVTACSEAEDAAVRGPVPLSEILAPYDAWCTVLVDGRGEIDTESDYLPHVVQCENGGAGLEALKAQAIAARSVAYWSMATHGSICDGQQCQVYSCGHEPNELVRRAVAETAGQYLSYGGVLSYGFYVSGDSQTSPPSCEGDPDGQLEHLVTYNDGSSGTDVEQTELGYVFDPEDAGYGQNRGCMSQWGARCLEGQGRDAAGILRFYYGADIEIRQASGSCAAPPEPPPPEPPPPEPPPPEPPPPEPPPPEPPPPTTEDCGVLLPGDSLAPDEGVMSCDGRFTLVPQSDGNLVLYQQGVGALWHTSTHGNTMGGLWMQEDGNLVLYDAGGVPLWHTSTHGRSGSILAMQDDGNVVVYLGDEALWNSGTCCR